MYELNFPVPFTYLWPFTVMAYAFQGFLIAEFANRQLKIHKTFFYKISHGSKLLSVNTWGQTPCNHIGGWPLQHIYLAYLFAVVFRFQQLSKRLIIFSWLFCSIKHDIGEPTLWLFISSVHVFKYNTFLSTWNLITMGYAYQTLD